MIVTLPSLFDDAEQRSIAIGRAQVEKQAEERIQQERRSIMNNLIAGGMPPKNAARYTGLSQEAYW